MKAAAYTQGGKDWEKLFREQDKDHSGQVDWPEFLSMCRRVLKLTSDKADDKSLGRVFGMLDGDRSGTVSIEELCAFDAEGAPLPPAQDEWTLRGTTPR